MFQFSDSMQGVLVEDSSDERGSYVAMPNSLMLIDLHVDALRVLALDMAFSPGINVIWGDNGSGKSSILEASYYLGHGRSFRTSQVKSLIAYQADSLVIRANVHHEDHHQLALVRHQDGFSAKLNQNPASLSDLSKHMPMLYVDCDSHRHFFGSPAVRRRTIDWLVFHVEFDYINIVRSYNHALKQRNHALKNNYPLTPWDEALDKYGSVITKKRQAIRIQLEAELKLALEGLGIGSLDLSYDPGYDVDQRLKDHLVANRVGDKCSGTTKVGPHRADWHLRQPSGLCATLFSQGQQKSVYFALAMAFHAIMEKAGRSVTILMDDVAAELDESKRAFITDTLIEKQKVYFNLHTLQRRCIILRRASVSCEAGQNYPQLIIKTAILAFLNNHLILSLNDILYLTAKCSLLFEQFLSHKDIR